MELHLIQLKLKGKNLIVTCYLRPPLHISSSRVVAMEEMDVTVRELFTLLTHILFPIAND